MVSIFLFFVFLLASVGNSASCLQGEATAVWVGCFREHRCGAVPLFRVTEKKWKVLGW